MIEFIQHSNTRLYVPAQGSGAGYIAFLLCDPDPGPPGQISLQQAWEEYIGYYLFLRTQPADLDAFATAAAAHFDTDPDYTSFAWVSYTNGVIATVGVVETAENDEEEIVFVRDVTISFGGYGLPLMKDAPVFYELGNNNEITGFIFTYPPHPGFPEPDPPHDIHLSFEGAGRGCFQCDAMIGDFSDDIETGWNMGLRYVLELDGVAIPQLYQIFDLVGGRHVVFWMCWDPVDQLNPARTYLAFNGGSLLLIQDSDEPPVFHLELPPYNDILPTHFRTVTGDRVGFRAVKTGPRPSKLVFERKIASDDTESPLTYYLVPMGDFEIELITATGAPLSPEIWQPDPPKFLCGLSGIESVGFTPRITIPAGVTIGDVISFFPGKPAYAPVYPIVQEEGEETEVQDAGADNQPLLTAKFVTSWATLGLNPVRSNLGGPTYYAQPEDAPLYNRPATGGSILNLLEPVASLLAAPAADHCFPMAPPLGAFPNILLEDLRPDFLQEFEAQILSPMRRERIRHFPVVNPPSGLTPAMAGPVLGATPQGLIAEINGIQWTRVELAESRGGRTEKLQFRMLNRNLQSALQTNQLFLVVTLDAPIKANGGIFDSKIFIENWPFELDLGKNKFGVFKNTLIFKFSPGKLVDRVRDPKSWTNADIFNRNGPGELDTLSSWISNYIAEGVNRAEGNEEEGIEADEAYDHFMQIVTDEDWNGILALNVDVDLNTFPEQLQALLAGINLERFCAHHFGVEASYVDTQAGTQLRPKESSLFGLIHYEDSAGSVGGVGDDPAQQTVLPDYLFKVLTLKVLFENSSVSEFSSVISLTLNRILGEPISHTVIDNVVGDDRQILLVGTYETHSGTPSFVFSLEKPVQFVPLSKVVRGFTISKAQFYTVVNNPNISSAVPQQQRQIRGNFQFCGNLGFNALTSIAESGQEIVFDIFSFDRLEFTNLVLGMSFYIHDNRTVRFSLETERMWFNQDESLARPNSMFKKFPVRLQGLKISADRKRPSDLGYAAIVPPMDIGSVGEGWIGLEYRLNLGTLGENAANAGITADLMAAWSPNPDRISAEVGMKLPGVSGPQNDILSLQGVLKIAADYYQFITYNANAQDIGYMLLLRNIGLRVLGVKLPFGSSMNFMLFGNPEPNADRPDDTIGWYASYNRANG